MIASLGSYCHVAEGLRDCGARTCSYPFDWITSPLASTHAILLKILQSSSDTEIHEFCDHFFDQEGNLIQHLPYNNTQYFTNVEYNVIFPHDDPKDILAKYKRRFCRFRTHFYNSDSVTFVYASRWTKHDAELTSLFDGIAKLRNDVKFVVINALDSSYERDNVILYDIPFPKENQIECENNFWRYDQEVYKQSIHKVICEHFN